MSLTRFLKYFFRKTIHRFIIQNIGNLIGKIICFLPEKLKKSIIFYRTDIIKDPHALQIYNNGFTVIKIKDQETLNTLKKVRYDIQEKIKAGSIKFSSEEDFEKSFIKILTKHTDRKNLFLIANNIYILKVVREYFGFYPTIRSIDIWANFPTNNEQNATQFFHRDPDDVFLVKLFLPLTKIIKENGPFQYVKYSHRNIYKEEFSKWFIKRYGSKRKKIENYLMSKFQKNIFSFTGDLGEGCLADTNGLHRGLKPINGIRLMIAISYCSPYPNFDKHYL